MVFLEVETVMNDATSGSPSQFQRDHPLSFMESTSPKYEQERMFGVWDNSFLIYLSPDGDRLETRKGS